MINEILEQKIKQQCPTLYSILKLMVREKQEDRPHFGEVYQKCKEYVDKLENKKIGVSDQVRQKINELNVKGISKKSNNSFEDIGNIIESYIQLNR